MNALLAFSRGVDWVTERIGRGVYWLLLAAVLISTVNALVRYTFDIGSNAFLEAQWYLFAAVFTLGAGYVFLHDQHVRIDVLAGKLPRKVQVWIDVIGIGVFLIPLCIFIVWTSLPSVGRAIETGEVSANPGGLIRWPLYALVPIGFTLLALQSASELFKRIAFLAGAGPDPHAKPEETADEVFLHEMQREQEEREAREAAAALAAKVGDTTGGRP
ncbi:MAG: TRAP transporter small permease subunit [Ideonella sp.]|nr:TRAP transporter small permease subunit [Ideonella sp.]